MSKKDQKPEKNEDLDRDIDDMFGDTIKADSSINPMLKSNSTPFVGLPAEDGPQSLRKSVSEKQFNNDSDDASVGKQTKSQNSGAEKGQKHFPKKNSKSDLEEMSHMQVIRVNMRAKVDQTKESVIKGAKYVRQLDMKQVKDKYNEADKFWTKSKSLLKQSGSILQNQEPEIKRTPYWGWLKYIITLVIVIIVIIYVVQTNLSMIGTEKTQEVTILKKNELLYNITGGIYTLMPLHFFTTLNKNKLIDRMECLVQGNKKQCNAYEFRKCEIVGIKVPEYDECMILAYGLAGYPLRSFCDKHYDATSTAVWTKAEAVSNGYLDQKYACLKNAGVPKGLTYCEDLQRISGSAQDSQMQLYDCYIASGVSNDTFADDRCSYLHDKNSYDPTVRQGYIRCMNESGQSVGDNPKFVCNNKFPWRKDDAFIMMCNSSFNALEANLVKSGSESPNIFDNIVIPPIEIPPIDLSAFGGLRRRMQFGFAAPTVAPTTAPATTTTEAPTSPFDSLTNFGDDAASAFDVPSLDTSAFNTSALDLGLDGLGDLADFVPVDLASFDLSTFVTDFSPDSFYDSIYQTWASYGAFNYVYLGYNPTQKQQDDIAYLEKAYADAMAAYNLALEAEEEEVPEEEEEEEVKSLNPFDAFVELVVDAFNGTETDDPTGEGGDPFGAFEELLKPPSLEDFFVPIVLTFDVDIGYKAPEISNWTKSMYGDPTADSCTNYLQNGYDLQQCYQQNVQVYDYETCNTRTWVEWYVKSIDAKHPNITPPAGEYFNCYFEELPITKDPKYAAEHKEACQSLYSNQRELLECYKYMDIPYGFEDEMKVCTNKYKFQSQIEKLYICLEEFGMEKNIDYCNIHPDFNIIDFDLPDTLHLNFMTLSKKPFFNCIAEVDEKKAERSDSRQCTADIYLFEKVEETFTADGMLNPSDFGIPAIDFNSGSFDPDSLDPTASASTDSSAPTSSFPQPDYEKITDCLFYYKMPPSAVQEQICRWKHIPDKGTYESTLTGCLDKYNPQCFPKYFLQVFSNDDCNEKYDEDYQFLTGGEEQFLETFGVQCRKVVIDYTPFNACMKKVDSGSTLAQMNEWKKSQLEQKGLPHQPYRQINNASLADYCKVMFAEDDVNDYVECMKYINQPLGAQECLTLPEYQGFVEKEYLFPYYQKYICLTFKETIIDDEAKKCIYNGNTFLFIGLDMEFVTINDCLKNYETEEGYQMNLRDIGGTSIYERVEGASDYVSEDEDDGIFSEDDIVKDLPTTLTDDQILEFLCNDEAKRMSLNFTTTPFQKIEDYQKKKYNSMDFEMACEMFTQFNGTHNNTVIHFSFPVQNQMRKLNDSSYDGSFNDTYLTIKRTDTNEQFFNLTMSEDLNFLQVSNHLLYFYDSANQVSLKNGEEFAQFQSHPNTTTIMETDSMIIFDHVAKEANVKAIPVKVVEVGKIIERRILGIGIQYSDVTAKKIEFEKVDDVIPVQERQSLPRKVLKAQQNSLIVNLKLGFGEQTVEYKFFTFGDIIGKIGGLWATYKSLIAYFAVFYIVQYAVSFASMAKRKDQQQIRLIEIAQYMKHIDSIKESLQDLILIQSGKVKQALKDDVRAINDAIDLETDMYDTTVEKHEVLKSMVQKYYPEGINDLFCIDACADEWERLQVYDTEKKHAYLTNKVGFGWGQMIDDMQFRMSIYGIYKMKDQAEIENIRILQTKEQLNNANARIKKLEEKIK